MKKDIYALFNIEQDEKASVVLLLIQSVFLGIFYGAFDVGAHAMFLSVYPAEMIPNAYVISGLVGIVLTTVYARLQNKITFSKLALINLAFISVSAAVLRLLFEITSSNWLVFLLLIMMGPLNIIALLGFWGAAGRIFSLRQGKRLFGLIDSGQIFGAILSTFAIPVLIAIGFEQKNLLLLSSVSVAIAFVLQIIISIKFNLNQQILKNTKEQKRLPELLKNKYVLHMAIFVIMSMLTAFFIQFSFLSVTKENYPDHNDLTEFLGAFTGSLLLFTFLFKTFVYSKLMKAYGLKLSILISPFLLGIFTIIAVLVGSLGGYTSISSSFIFFFLIIALSRLFSKALKDGIEVPSFKILYQSLKSDIRYDVQAYVDGTINEIAALFAGLMLAVLGLFQFFKLIHFSVSLFIILFIWFFIARKLYSEYKLSLQKSLSDYKSKDTAAVELTHIVKDDIQNAENTLAVINGIELAGELHPIRFSPIFKTIAIHKDKMLSDYALDKIHKLSIDDTILEIATQLKGASEILEKKYAKSILTIDKSPGIEKILNLLNSKSTNDKIIAAYLLGKFYQKDWFIYLKSMLRDINPTVKIAAIKAAVSSKDKDFCPLICEYIDTPGLLPYAYDALIQFGDDALSILDQYYYKTGVEQRVLLRIIKLIEQIATPKIENMLLKKLDYSNEELLQFILKALNKINYKADEKGSILIHQILEEHIRIMAYHFAAKATIEESKGFEQLKVAIEEELAVNFNTLYLLLSLAYDSKSIMHVKENLESGTSEGVSYALELLDLFVKEEIKPKLFPVVEDITLNEKVRQLQSYYPVEKTSLKETIISLINSDINKTSLWTKVNAIYALLELNEEITDDLISQAFNPIDILKETAIFVIKTLDINQFNSISNRLKKVFSDEEHLTSESIEKPISELLIQKVWFLSSFDYFKQVSGRYLYYIAKCMHDLNSENLEFTDLIKSDLIDKFILVKGEGSIIKIDDEENLYLQNGEIYDMNILLKQVNKKISIELAEKSIIYYIHKQDLVNNMLDFHEIENSFVLWLESQKESIKK